MTANWVFMRLDGGLEGGFSDPPNLRWFDAAKPLMQSLLVVSLGFWLQWG